MVITHNGMDLVKVRGKDTCFFIEVDSDLRDHFTGPNLTQTSRLYLQ
jgi:hypothetical protein